MLSADLVFYVPVPLKLLLAKPTIHLTKDPLAEVRRKEGHLLFPLTLVFFHSYILMLRFLSIIVINSIVSCSS